MDMPAYREYVIRSLTSHPPGSDERLHRLEGLRLEAVRDLAAGLSRADDAVIAERRRGGGGGGGRRRRRRRRLEVGGEDEAAPSSSSSSPAAAVVRGPMVVDDEYDYPDCDDDHRDDADASIRDDLEEFFEVRRKRSHDHHLDEKTSGGGGTDGMMTSNVDNDDPRTRWNSFGSRNVENSVGGGGRRSSAIIGRTSPAYDATIVGARELLDEARDFLPQLVSTVLHSPPSPLYHHHHHHHHNHRNHRQQPDPISSLRSLLIERCRSDPGLGIELCWLLEAEVGRKWKALFEHRQSTGRRLILIVQADIAAAIAAIGAERASAFNLLQDAETATAFGVDRKYEDVTGSDHAGHHDRRGGAGGGGGGGPPRSVSDLRCRHFGDSMHLIDRLTQVSLDLRLVPHAHRQSHLASRLRELNRRLCRRMATRGRMSIDVDEEENPGLYPHPTNQQQGHHPQHPYGGHHHAQQYSVPPRWSEEDVREDMIRHSVHLPMEPRCPRGWPGGAEAPPREHHRPNDDGVEDFAIDDDLAIDDRDGGGEGNCDPATAYRPERRRRRSGGVVRALRILPENCRVLSSATRCPFLVRMEVVETGLDADDARLYVAGSSSSLTVQEALGSLRAPYGNPALSGDDDIGAMVGWLDDGDDAVGGAGGFPPCEIPPELMMTHGHRGGGGGLRYRDDAASSEVEDDAPSAARRDHRDDDDRVRHSFEHPPPPPRDYSSISHHDEGIPNPHSGFVNAEESKAVLSRGGGYHQGGGDYGYDLSPPDAFDMVGGHYYEELHHDLRQQREGEFNQPNPPFTMGTVGYVGVLLLLRHIVLILCSSTQ